MTDEQNAREVNNSRDGESQVIADPLPESPFVNKAQFWLVVVLVFLLSVGASLVLPGALNNGPDFDGVYVEGDVDMNEHVRRIRVEPEILYTPEELKNILRANTPGFADAEEEAQRKAEEAWDKEIADLVNEDGLVSQDSLPKQFKMQAVEGFAVLIGDYAVVPSSAMAQPLNVPADVADRVSVRVTLLPDPELDDVDDWKNEELFNGSAEDFVNASDVQIDSETNLAYFRRPANKKFADPGEEFYKTADLEDVNDLNTVVFPSALGAHNTSESGEVVGTIDDRDLLLVRGAFAAPGTPVFLVNGDGELVFAGILVGEAGNGVGAVASSDVILDKVSKEGEEK